VDESIVCRTRNVREPRFEIAAIVVVQRWYLSTTWH
jgi:hypothetical protein